MNIRLLKDLAVLVQKHNEVDLHIAQLIGRPAERGHVGEFICTHVFDIELAASASNKGRDGTFRSGAIDGSTVNIKWYGKREGILDLVVEDPPEYYLVLTGSRASSSSSKGATRPWVIEGAYLFQTQSLHSALVERGVKMGTATSVANQYWDEAELFPCARSVIFRLSADQQEVLRLFSSKEV